MTPSDIAPVRLSQQQIDELEREQAVADVLPLTPLQQGLLFHARAAGGDDDLYAVQLVVALDGAVGPGPLRPAVPTVGGTAPAPALAREVRFDGVHFAYTPDRPVLAGLDLTLPAGTSTAVVGVNGAGKTTAVKLLTGLYRPARGRVLCDGVDLADVHPPDWQAHVAVVFQDFVRYELDLADNVAMGAVAHRTDEVGICDVLAAVGLGGIAPDTPLTRLLPGGRDLSGGQWQRVALARALFAVRHGASLLVLDEPTAQLDARGEGEFYATFLDLTRGVTSLVISHRFSSVRRADRIVVLEDGRAAEHGTHDELVVAGGRYADLFAVQARRFAP